MKSRIKTNTLALSIIFAFILMFSFNSMMAQDSVKVQNQHQYKKSEMKQYKGEKAKGFADEDGDGIPDNARMHKAQTKSQFGIGFVDEDGDGINDNAPDHDGDGIPNGMDPDFEGSKNRYRVNSKGFVDEDGDGLNDNAQDDDGDGIPNGQDPDYVRPEDGSGNMHRYRHGGENTQLGGGIGNSQKTGPKSSKKGSGGK